eukprot:TRINITY_DN3007_c0_g1_i1.p1 TRINITY_DN3007_c0_g1~~TRINITY_DN3007_c0_g1_i1.p1  ORF type:complete len:587 (-),score=118.93 TRINITY_DN3007_c0_g1_i1:126-1886(-)
MAMSWVQDIAQLARKLQEERESSKVEAAAAARALTNAKVRNQEVGTELSASLAKKAAANQQVLDDEHRLQATRESMLRLEQQEAVAAVTMAHKDSQMSLLSQCQHFLEQQARVLQMQQEKQHADLLVKQQEETRECKQEALRAKQEASFAQQVISKLKLDVDELRRTLDTVQESRDKHVNEVDSLRRSLEEVRAARDQWAKEVDILRQSLLEAQRSNPTNLKLLRGDGCLTSALLVGGGGLLSTAATASVAGEAIHPSCIGVRKQSNLFLHTSTEKDHGRGGHDEAKKAGEHTTTSDRDATCSGQSTVKNDAGLERNQLDHYACGPAQAGMPEMPKVAANQPADAEGIEKKETAEQRRSENTGAPEATRSATAEQRRSENTEAPSATHSGAAAGSTPQSTASSKKAEILKCATAADQLAQFCVQHVQKYLPAQELAKHDASCPVPPKAPPIQPWRSASSCPRPKRPRLLLPGPSGRGDQLEQRGAASDPRCCQECGEQKSNTILDASDNLRYCQECWLAFYGQPPGSDAAGPATRSAKPPHSACRFGLKRFLGCKPGGQWGCRKCPNTFTTAKNLRRHVQEGRCRG